MYTKQNVIEILGMETENVENNMEFIEKVLDKANELSKQKEIDFAFKQDLADNRIPHNEIIDSIEDVVFWYTNK